LTDTKRPWQKNLVNAIEAMESMMSPESVERSRKKAEQEIMAIKLSQIREKRGLKQDEKIQSNFCFEA